MSAEASQLTFEFEAEVTDIVASPIVDFTLPPEIVVGGVFEGRLSFEPPLVFGQTTQNAAMHASIGSVSFLADGLEFVTENDFGFVVGGSVVSEDRIRVACGETIECNDIVSSVSNISVDDFGFALVGDSTSINPLFETGNDPKVWNRLSGMRRLFLELTSSAGAGSYTVHGTIGPVYGIPEPRSIELAVLMPTLVILASKSRRSRPGR
jgi:hypothetical protein